MEATPFSDSLQNAEARPVAWKPPSGQQLGFLHSGNGDGLRAYMVDAAGGAARPVPELENVNGPISSFWWSLDGSWIVYSTPKACGRSRLAASLRPQSSHTPVTLSVQNFIPATEGQIVGGYDRAFDNLRIIYLDRSIERSIDIRGMVDDESASLHGSSDRRWIRPRSTDIAPHSWRSGSVDTPRGVYVSMPVWTTRDRTLLTFFSFDTVGRSQSLTIRWRRSWSVALSEWQDVALQPRCHGGCGPRAIGQLQMIAPSV